MPETPEAIRGLADTMVTRFTPPSFVPGCEVKSIADIDDYATDNGWIEAIVGGDNQQRVRYYGTPQGVEVGNKVDVEYFPAYKLYRVFGATLGGTASVGGLRVSKVWDSDFGDVAFEAGTVNLTVNGTRTLTIPTDLVHADDPNTKIGFTPDKHTHTVGGLVAFQLTNTAQNLVEIGDVAGTGDWDVNINNGQVFVQGSDGNIGFGTITPNVNLVIFTSGTSIPNLSLQDGDITLPDYSGLTINPTLGDNEVARLAPVSGNFGGMQFIGLTDTTAGGIATIVNGYLGSNSPTAPAVIVRAAKHNGATTLTSLASSEIVFQIRNWTSDNIMTVLGNGDIGINSVTSPSTALDTGAGAIEGEEMTAPGAGAANTYRLYAEDNGAGKTRLMVIFNTGAAQQIAIQP
jgi:hypothetical protein